MSGERLRHLRAPAVAVAQPDNLIASGKHPRNLDGGLVGFRAAVREVALADLSGSDLGDLFRQGDDGFIGKHGGGMLQLCLLYTSDAADE